MKSAGKARNNGLYRHIRTSKEIIRNLLNDYMKRIIGILLAIVLTSSVICSTLFTSYAEEPSSTSVSSSSSQTTDPTNPPVEGDAMTGDGEIA